MPYATQMGLPWAPQSESSYEAAKAAEAFANSQEDRVYAFIAGKGERGATMEEAEVEMPIKRSSACGRFFGLASKGRIRKVDGLRRGGCGVYVVTAGSL